MCYYTQLHQNTTKSKHAIHQSINQLNKHRLGENNSVKKPGLWIQSINQSINPTLAQSIGSKKDTKPNPRAFSCIQKD